MSNSKFYVITALPFLEDPPSIGDVVQVGGPRHTKILSVEGIFLGVLYRGNIEDFAIPARDVVWFSRDSGLQAEFKNTKGFFKTHKPLI